MNPRNSAAGTIRQLDPARRGAGGRCRCGATRSASSRASRFKTTAQALDWLREHGFRVNPDIKLLGSEEEVIAQCLDWQERRGELDFEIDGVVVKVSDLELQRRLGAVGRDPRWAVAWKFPPTTAETRLEKVMWNVGKFGDLHPYAVLEPVEVGGVTIKLATLHNEEDLVRKDMREGEEVIVLRAGDVIPQVVSPAPHVVEQQGRPPRPRPPGRCPFCNTPTVKPKGVGVHEVPQPRLPRARVAAAQALRLARRDGHRRARREAGGLLQQRGLVQTAGDFYRLREEQLLELDGFAEISARNLIAAIEASKRAAVRARAVRARDRGGRRGHRPQPRAALPRHRRAAGGATEEIARDARGRREDGGVDPRAARRRADARADRGPARDRPALRGGGPPPSEGPLAGKTLVLTGTLPTLIARAGHRADHRRGRARDEQRSRRRPTTSSPARAPARSSRRPSAWACRCSTKRGCASCWVM